MKFYGIKAVAEELQLHPSSLRRWEDKDLIAPERVVLGKKTVRIYDDKLMRVLRRAKELMTAGLSLVDAFGYARKELERDGIQQEEQHND